MSKLINHVNAVITNKREVIAEPLELVSTSLNVHKNTLNNYAYYVSFNTVFGKTVVVDESHAYKDSPYMSFILTDIRKSLVEEVFGEFRNPIRSIVHSIYDRKYEEAIHKLHNLEKQMFDI